MSAQALGGKALPTLVARGASGRQRKQRQPGPWAAARRTC